VRQTLLVLIKKVPPKGRRLLIIGTTAQMNILEHMEIASVFSVMLNVPTLSDEAIKTVLESQACMAAADIAQVRQSGACRVCHVQRAFGGYPAVRRRISFEAYLRW
jgi:vesicle-fusing ATPase